MLWLLVQCNPLNVITLGQRETDNINRMKTLTVIKARSHGLVVKGEDSQLSGCGFESWHRILDGCKRC